MRKTLQEIVAIITGASGGIGAATVREFVKHGANVVLAAPVDELPVLYALAREAESFGVQALVVPTDVAKRADVDALVARTLERFGRLDVLANIAGVGSSPSVGESTDEELERVIAVNLLGCARTIHAVLPVMKAQCTGSIVNIGSVAGEAAVMGIYSASKFGLRGLNDTVRREVRSFNIGVTLIEPGFIQTPMNPSMSGLPGPEIVARAIVQAVRSPRRKNIVPKRYRLPVVLAAILPGLMDLVFGNATIQDRLNRDARAERKTSESAPSAQDRSAG